MNGTVPNASNNSVETNSATVEPMNTTPSDSEKSSPELESPVCDPTKPDLLGDIVDINISDKHNNDTEQIHNEENLRQNGVKNNDLLNSLTAIIPDHKLTNGSLPEHEQNNLK